MDLIAGCKDKLAYFRIKELKDALTQIGLAKQGKKQDLADRILAALLDEQVPRIHGGGKKNPLGKEEIAKIIDDIYRKMQPGAVDLASNRHGGSEMSTLRPKEELDDCFRLDMKVRCPCGSSLINDSMIKCDDPKCDVWQHMYCVIIPENPVEGVPPQPPPQFYCSICRINRANPFWVTLAHPLQPLKLTGFPVVANGTNQPQTIERTFPLTRADRDLLQKAEYDLQVWCILLNDKVPFRMQWPQFSELQVNGVPVRTTNRPGSQLLGINGRDDGPIITTCSREGMNKITFSRCDSRVFTIGVRIVKRRTMRQVLDMIPKESDGERFQDAVARVCRCIGGGTTTDNGDSDSDLEVVADSFTVNLRCPMSGSRMKIAGRFKPCVHMGCFDLETFIELNQRSHKWQCPICLKNYSLENIIIDPYFTCITTLMRDCGEDTTEIEVKPNASWRVKNDNESFSLRQWHSPDGSLSVTPDLIQCKGGVLNQIKKEGSSEIRSGLKLGLKKNINDVWEIIKSENKYDDYPQNSRIVSEGSNGNYRDGEVVHVNQGGGGAFDFPMNGGYGHGSASPNFDPQYDALNRSPAAPLNETNVIILSDSEDSEKENSPENVFTRGSSNGNTIPFSVPTPVVNDIFQDDTGQGTSGNSYLDLFNSGDDDFGEHLWQLPTVDRTASGFQLFDTETNVTDALLLPNSGQCPINGSFEPETITRPMENILNHSNQGNNSEMNGCSADTPLEFCTTDPSLQFFLSPLPGAPSLHDDIREYVDPPSKTVLSEDWISLSLGGGGVDVESVVSNDLSSITQFTTRGDGMGALSNAATFLSTKDDDTRSNHITLTRDRNTLTREQPNNLFSDLPQPRSVRQRLYLSIDTDSE